MQWHKDVIDFNVYFFVVSTRSRLGNLTCSPFGLFKAACVVSPVWHGPEFSTAHSTAQVLFSCTGFWWFDVFEASTAHLGSLTQSHRFVFIFSLHKRYKMLNQKFRLTGDSYAEENHSTAFSIINRESGILSNKRVGWKLSWLFWKIQLLLMPEEVKHLSPDNSLFPPWQFWELLASVTDFSPVFSPVPEPQALKRILLLIASMNLESGAVCVHIGCPLLGSADTSVWRQGHLKSTNCLLTVLDCLVTICLGQLPLII